VRRLLPPRAVPRAQSARPADPARNAGSAGAPAAVPEAQLEQLAEAARFGIAHRRVPRLHGAERATVGARALPQLPRADRQGRMAAAARFLRGLSLQSGRLLACALRAQLLRDDRDPRSGSSLLAGAPRGGAQPRSPARSSRASAP
jgi:hypothetical protein